MTGHRIEVERLVRAPAERVWAVLTDIAHADQTLAGVTKVEQVTEGPYRVGTTWRETRRMFGREDTQQMEVTLAEEPTRTVVESDSSGVHYVTEFTLTPTGDATRLRMSFTAVQARTNPMQKALWALFGTLGAKATEKMMANDLHDIAARAESR
ncbi:SRPBCC family protein [Antribacter sp. KLBMP9083]|uniref:SRPBCC family protein n=1 Tax=Antribacter soli TaxID=2910976 RepID=A0AA41QCT0_9MICO|nr:SRPBCC family protein [Antribacter soli]MCF4121075.1 SRPBCC family protein [Antribacter soli]